MRTTKIKWYSVKKDGLPTKEEFGPYPRVLVALSCVGHQDWHRIAHAELRFFGDDPKRPYWCDLKGCEPIENNAWYVKYWAPAIATPLGCTCVGEECSCAKEWE